MSLMSFISDRNYMVEPNVEHCDRDVSKPRDRPK